MGRDFEFDQDAVTAKPVRTGRPWEMSVRGLMTWIFGVACGLGLLMALYESVRDPVEVGRRAQCANNLKQIALALYNYHEQFGTFPPAYVADASGRPMHTWRVLILPFLKEGSLHGQYNFREPWNGPNNHKLLNKMPRVFSCPSRTSSLTNLTSYVLITGPGTMFPGAASVKIADITDGLADTLMVVETANLDVPWTAPVDLDLRSMSLEVNDRKSPGISSKHGGIACVVFGDLRIRYLRKGLAEEILRALITITGGEKIKADEALEQK